MIKVLQGTISYPEVKWGKAEDRAAKNTPLIKFVSEMKTVGADGIELWGRHLDNLSLADVQTLASEISASGQKVEVLAAYWDFSSADSAVESSLEDARRFMGFCDLFGARAIRVFAGGPASASATDENWKRAISGMKRLAKMYKGTGVTFVVETHADQLPDTPDSAARLMKELAEPSILINYQHMKGDALKEMATLWRWIAHVHVSFVKDWGAVNETIVRELVKRGFNGAITVEFCTDSLPEEGQAFDRAKAMAGMKSNIASIRHWIK
jgi:sugar phosphate isomerase/epimerase